MYERFTDRARKVVKHLANEEAKRFNHEYIGTEHLLLGLVKEGSGVAANVLKNLDIDLGKIRLEIEKILQSGPDMVTLGKLPQTPRASKVIEYAIEEARKLNHQYVGTEHLLLGLIVEEQGVAAQVLMNLGLTAEQIRIEIMQLLGYKITEEKINDVPPRPKADPPSAEGGSPIVKGNANMYGRFTDRAIKVMQLANQEAQRLNHGYIGTEHILLGLIKEGSGVAGNVLKNLDLDLPKLRLEAEKIVQSGPDMVTMGRLPQTPLAKKVMEYALEEAYALNHNYVGTEHLLLGLTRAPDTVAGQVLMNLGLNLLDIREQVLDMLGHPRPAKNDAGDGAQKVASLSVAEEMMRLLFRTTLNDRERIRALEQQFWNVRVVLGALVGAITGALLIAQFGAIMGLLLGGLVAALGWRTLGILAGGIMGILLGCTHLPNDGGQLAGALLGAAIGFLIAEIGRSNKPV